MQGKNRNLAEVDLKSLLDSFRKDLLLNLNCHAVAKVKTFDSVKQTISATVNYKKSFVEYDPTSKQQKTILVDYPFLVDCPVVCLGGGKAHLTFPIIPGDDCLILFNDRSLDNWFASGQNVELSDSRLHSFADGVALVGLNSQATSITTYDGTHADLRNDKAHVAISPTKIKIYNDTKNLKTVLTSLVDTCTNLEKACNKLVTAASAITVTCVITPPFISSPPLNVANITAVAGDLSTVAGELSTVKSDLSALLE